MRTEVRHQAGGQILHIHHVVADGAGKPEAHAHVRVLEFRPEDAGRVQKLQRFIHRNPLLAARHAGAVLRLGGLSAGHLVDEGRFADVRDAEHHHAQHAPDLPLFLVSAQLVRKQRAHGGRELLHARAGLGVDLQHRIALRAEPCRPLLRRLGVRLIDAVEHHDARLARRQIVEVGVAARARDARVDDLAHRVHAADLGGDHAARFCHVSGEPAQTFQLHDRFPLTSFSKNRGG